MKLAKEHYNKIWTTSKLMNEHVLKSIEIAYLEGLSKGGEDETGEWYKGTGYKNRNEVFDKLYNITKTNN